MAVQLDASSAKDDLKTQFITREGTYRLMTLNEYSRPNRVGYQSNQNNPQVRVSLVTLPTTPPPPPLPAAAGGVGSCSGFPSGSVAVNNCSAVAATTAVSPSNDTQSPQSVTSSVGGMPQSGSITMAGGQPMQMMANGQHDCLLTNGQPYGGGDRICFNFGKELYVYAYRGVKKSADLSKPIDKKLYKGTNPSCHDFNNSAATPEGAPLLVGFTTGQIQLVQPGRREPGKLYNEERLIDKTKVTCLKWVPNSPHLFLAGHSSGHLYLYNEELLCTAAPPTYQPFKQGDGYSIHTCKSKSTRNPLYKWQFVGTESAAINEFCFSPCGTMLAVVSQDGFLRVFHYDTMELCGIARSYFGGFLCVCWSPDGKYIVVGGEDDLVTVWSVQERRVVARGQGHRSWVSVVAFDPYTTSYSNWEGGGDFSDDENPPSSYATASHFNKKSTSNSNNCFENNNDCDNNMGRRSVSIRDSHCLGTSYRLGSVSQDTQLCLWDITEDVLRQAATSYCRQRLSSGDAGVMQNGASDAPTMNNGGTSDKEGTVGNSYSLLDNKINETNCNSKFNNNVSNSKKLVTQVNNCDGAAVSNALASSHNTKNSKHSRSSTTSTNKTASVITNCIGVSSSNSFSTDKETDEVDVVDVTSPTVAPASAVNNKNSTSSTSSTSSSNTTSSSGFNAFNTLTQRLSNSFGFKSNSSSDHHHNNHHSNNSSNNHSHNKKSFTLTLKSNNHYNHNHVNSTTMTESGHSSAGPSTSSRSKQQKHQLHQEVVASYDPMRLIGTPVCPRFDECPILEPLVCKKIAHERLTALIFREDCFLTACQDGFIYTWARPGYSNVPQQQQLQGPQNNMSSSPTAMPPPPGGTVV